MGESFCLTVEVDSEYLSEDIVASMSKPEIVKFITLVDAEVAETEFTIALIEALVDVLRHEGVIVDVSIHEESK